ncbi:MAG: hypothetical protein AMK69_26470 [Nitrospira bacterium SG8_3]|nr:MAG: hypothetical protein AMK69_26470 [Nitrospira bacterium SG8_3]
MLQDAPHEASGTRLAKSLRKHLGLVVAELEGRSCPHPALGIEHQSPSKPRTVFLEAAAFFVQTSASSLQAGIWGRLIEGRR